MIVEQIIIPPGVGEASILSLNAEDIGMDAAIVGHATAKEFHHLDNRRKASDVSGGFVRANEIDRLKGGVLIALEVETPFLDCGSSHGGGELHCRQIEFCHPDR